MTFREHTDALAEHGATVNIRIAPLVKSAGAGEHGEIPHELGRFRVLDEIARGGMGIVLRAYDSDLDREVAIKLHTPEPSQPASQEARITSRLRHAGIMPVYETGQLADGRTYFVMPLIVGATLATVLSRRKNVRQEMRRCLRYFVQASQAIGHAHACGVVHRDLKPGNVLVGVDGKALVMDWGVAVERSRGEPESASGWIFGTPGYMPPEQAVGTAIGFEPRSDVFGLGAILCEILTGQPPFIADDAALVRQMSAEGELRPCYLRLYQSGQPWGLIELAVQCLASDPERRPANGNAVVAWLDSLIRGRTRRRSPSAATRLTSTGL